MPIPHFYEYKVLRNSLESEKLLRKKYYNNNEIYIENVFKIKIDCFNTLKALINKEINQITSR